MKPIGFIFYETLAVLFGCFVIVGCGYASRDNESIGQVKKITKQTPIICPEYSLVDVSHGVMRNGVGSMSTEDVYYYVPSANHQTILKEATESGALVKIKYDVARLVFCVPDHIVTSVELVK